MNQTLLQKQLVDLSDALADLSAKAATGVVGVQSSRSRSSGFVWRSGLVVTADDPLPDEGDLSLTLPGGGTASATVAGRDPTTDIALLRVDRADVQPAPPATSAPRVGALVVAVGNEDGTPTAAMGTVALAGGAWQSMRGGEIDARIQLDLGLRRSGEGGLVLNAAGQAVGMAVFGPRGRVLVIPSATIDRVAARLASHGRVARGYFGLGLQTVTADAGRSGTMVMSVDPKGPGAVAGLRQGDVLLAWNGQPIGNVQSLWRSLGPDSVGRAVELELNRAGKPIKVSVTITEKPVN